MGGMPYRYPDEPDDESRREPTDVYTPPTIAPVVTPTQVRLPDNLEAQAKATYGNNWDADAQQQYNYRVSIGQSPDEILRHTAEDNRDRYYGEREQQAASGGGGSAPAFRNSSPSFTDPTQRLVEDSALARYKQLQNPDANSGQAMYEQYAKELIATLKGPVYSAGDEASIKAGALDSVFKDRDQTKQRWLETISQRGMSPSSGPALEGLRRIDEHYKTLQTTVDAQFARDAIDQTRAQRFQVLNTAGQLAGTENSRLDQALDVARIPYNLSNDAFSRNLSLVNAGGSPQAALNSALQLFQSNQYANAQSSAQRQELANGLLQYLGYMFG
jgi:hypothetical protein